MTKNNPIERDVKASVKRLLDMFQWFYWMPAANGFGTPGVSDILAIKHIKHAVFLAVECKTDKTLNKLTAHQVRFLRSVHQQGGHAFVVSEKYLPSFERWLELMRKSQFEITPEELHEWEQCQETLREFVG